MDRLTVTESPPADDLEAIGNILAASNAVDVGPSGHRNLSIVLYDNEGAVEGGLTGFTAWDWLFVKWLVVPQRRRGQGLAEDMLHAAEDEARARGCKAAWIDTFNPIARRAYEKAGYTVFGELEDFPHGRTRSFLRKQF